MLQCVKILSIRWYQADDCLEDPSTKTLIWRVDELLPWENARQVCRGLVGADLLVPKTASQRRILMDLNMMKNTELKNPWIGIKRQNGTLTYEYLNGSAVESYRWSTLYNCVNHLDCGFAFINWSCEGFNAAPYSDCTSFNYCSNTPCSSSMIFVCEIQYSST